MSDTTDTERTADIAAELAGSDHTLRLATAARLLSDPRLAEQNVDGLCERLEDHHHGVRELAVLALGNLRPVPVDRIAAALRRSQPDAVRTRAAQVLVPVARQAVAHAEALGACLLSASEPLRTVASLALSGMGPAALDVLGKVLEQSNNPQSTEAALAAVERIGPAAAPLQSLVSRLADSDDEAIAEAAARARTSVG